jgi:putative transposase
MNAKPGQKWREIKTSNWTKTQQQIAKLHERIANIRKDFIHQITNDLTERYDLIAIEDLNVKGMSSSVKPKKREDGKGYKQNGKKAQIRAE